MKNIISTAALIACLSTPLLNTVRAEEKAKDEMDVDKDAETFSREESKIRRYYRDGLLQLWTCGDSISSGYRGALQKGLKDNISYMHLRNMPYLFPDLDLPKYSGLSQTLIDNLRVLFTIDSYKPDVLLLNSGLHDAFRGKGKGEEKIANYEKNIQTIISIAKENDVPIVWVQTTSKVEGDPLNEYVEAFNKVTQRLMSENGYAVIDMNTFVKELSAEKGEDKVYVPDGVHFSNLGKAAQGNYIAEQLLEILADEIKAAKEAPIVTDH